MNEKEIGQSIARTLNLGLDQLDDNKLTRLHAARQKALGAYRPPVRILGLVTVSGNLFDVSSMIRKPLFLLPVFAIFIAVSTYMWNSSDDSYDDVGELDAKLLTGELPIDAFLDKDFATWVAESTH
ncbi:MAG: DUF3619 family protein [Betaproteobacteria bacterium]|nr:DUF3619 family protein [Betaproteobacteria bacterium]